MPRRQLAFTSQLPVSAEEAFAWHARPGAFERLTPPWQRLEIIERRGTIRDDDRLTLKVRLAPLVWKKWVAEHAEYIEGRQFLDEQISGPFAFWEHVHQFEPQGPDRSLLEDRVEFELPGKAVGDLLLGGAVRRTIERNFAYRHRVTRDDLIDHHRYVDRPRRRVLISGATGLVGSALTHFLSTGGHTTARLTRPESDRGGVRWDPEQGELDPHALQDFDAVVHLAGENVAAGRWTESQKRKILDSRTKGTRLLCETLAKMPEPRPATLLCASAVGFYGDTQDEEVDETSPGGDGFLAEVCRQWEDACAPARDVGIRVVHLRFGVILSPAGGALAKMLPPFQMGVGGRLGGGRQWMSWVALDDVLGAILHALMHDELSGPINVVAPHPVTNSEFTATLGRVLGRPTIFPVPAVGARLAFGQMAEEMLLTGQRVDPKRLDETGYQFRFRELEPALRHTLGRTRT